MKRNEVLRIEASALRVENKEFKNHVDAANTDIISLKALVRETREECSSEIAALRDRLLDARESEECHRNEAISNHETYEQYRANTEPRIRHLQAGIQRTILEKQLLSEEVSELRKLLLQSEVALENIHTNAGNVTAQACHSSWKKDESGKLYTLDTKYEHASMNTVSAPPSAPLHSQTDIHPPTVLPNYPPSTRNIIDHGDSPFQIKASKPPINIILQPLSERLVHVNGDIDREEGSVHSLDTFLTWETVKPTTIAGKPQIESPRECVVNERDNLSEERDKDADGHHERARSFTETESSHETQEICSSGSSEEGEVDYGSDFELESAQDCSKLGPAIIGHETVT